MREWTKKVISSLILFLLLVLLARYVIEHSHEFTELKIVSPGFLIILVMLAFMLILINGIIRKLVLHVYGLKTRFKIWFGLSAVTTFYNLITPFRGGSIAEATYLKKREGFRVTDYLSGFAVQYIVAFMLAGIIGIITLLMIRQNYGFYSSTIMIIFIVISILCFIIMMLPMIKVPANIILNKVATLLNGWNEFRKNRKILGMIVFYSLIELVIESLRLILQFHVIGVRITFLQGLFLSTLYFLSWMVAITPGGIGIQEAIVILSAEILGITPAQSIAATVIGRAVLAIILFILGPIYSYKLLRNHDNDPAINKEPLKESLEDKPYRTLKNNKQDYQ